MMRILFVSEGFEEKSIIAQPWRYIYEIANQFVKRQHEVAIATDSPYTSTCREEVVHSISTHILPRTRLPPTLSLHIDPWQLRNLVKEFSPDVIYWDGDALTGTRVRELKGIDVPVAVHISTNLFLFKDKTRVLIQEFPLIEYSFLTYLFTMSSPLIPLLVRLLNQEKINLITVPNLAIKKELTANRVLESKIKAMPTPSYGDGVFLDENTQDHTRTREKIGLDIGDFIVTYCGPSDTYRGTDTLLLAVAKLKEELPGLKLMMLLRQGFEREERRLEKLASKLMLGKHAEFVRGRLRRGDLNGYLQASNVIALPFKFLKNEPPIGVLEAMASGKPLITTSVSGLPELIGSDRGLLVKPGNSNELADAINYLAKNPKEAEAFGRRARSYVSQLPNWSELAHYISGLFEQILK